MLRFVVGPTGPIGTHSFTRGFILSKPPVKKDLSEDDILARALKWAQNGRQTEALEMIERYLEDRNKS